MVRLSQCMIVKNEEKNIERALSWAKGIAFEQIVVDTGSTDKTIERAKRLGAVIHHFEWINDFSAAKNFAMDKTTGDWIAILDADEYMSNEDAKKLISLLEQIQNDPVLSEECDAVTCQFINLDENGNAVSTGTHQRIFRNRSYLRYIGRIHEAVQVRKKDIKANDIRIFHTGYSKTAQKETDKNERNILMLRIEHKQNPSNPDTMHYLANSLLSLGTDEARSEAEKLHLTALNNRRKGNPQVRQLAYDFLIPRYTNSDLYADDPGKKDEAISLCSQAIEDAPENIDYRYYRAILNNKRGNHQAALDDLEECEKELFLAESIPTTRLLTPSPLPLFFQLVIAAEGLGDEDLIARNSGIITAILSDEKDQIEIVGPYIRAMSWYGLTDDEVFNRLASIYDLNDPKDMMLIAKAAKESGAIDFSRVAIELVGKLLNR